MLTVHLTTKQKVRASISPKIPFDGLPEWMIVDGQGTVEADDDGMSVELVSSDLPGETLYMVTVDTDLDWTVKEMSELIKVVVSAPPPASMGFLGLTAAVEVSKKEPVA